MDSVIDGFLSYFFEPVIRIEKIIAAYPAYLDKDFIFEGERHNFWELCYIYEGELIQTLDGKDTLSIQPGDIFLIAPDTHHRSRCNGRDDTRLFAVAFECSSPAMDFYKNYKGFLSGENKALIDKIARYCPDIFQSFSLVSDGATSYMPLNPDQTLGSWQCMINYLEILLVEHMRCALKLPVYSLSKTNRQQLLALNVMRYLDRAYDQNPSISEISSMFHCSPSYLMTIFKKHTGQSIGDYAAAVKLRRAKEYLEETDLNLSEIADRLSYSSLQYFSACFKRQTGMSPTEYRKSLR